MYKKNFIGAEAGVESKRVQHKYESYRVLDLRYDRVLEKGLKHFFLRQRALKHLQGYEMVRPILRRDETDFLVVLVGKKLTRT